MIQAADDMDKGPESSLGILSMIRDTTVRFTRLRAAGVNIADLTCGL